MRACAAHIFSVQLVSLNLQYPNQSRSTRNQAQCTHPSLLRLFSWCPLLPQLSPLPSSTFLLLLTLRHIVWFFRSSGNSLARRDPFINNAVWLGGSPTSPEEPPAEVTWLPWSRAGPHVMSTPPMHCNWKSGYCIWNLVIRCTIIFFLLLIKCSESELIHGDFTSAQLKAWFKM